MFGRPIGQNQGIQHPLAKCWAELEAANLMAFKAATLYDAGQPCGVEANAAKYLAAEACFHACETAVMSHRLMGGGELDAGGYRHLHREAAPGDDGLALAINDRLRRAAAGRIRPAGRR